MARGLQGVMLRGLGARDHKAMVVDTLRSAPHFVPVQIESSTLFDDAKAEPAAWLRFWFPDPNGSDTEFPRLHHLRGGRAD
jgi:NADPH-dependent ferric siderophore reductase